MYRATFDLDRRDIDTEALEQLAQHLALGGDVALMKLAFHTLEVFPGKGDGCAWRRHALRGVRAPLLRAPCRALPMADAHGT